MKYLSIAFFIFLFVSCNKKVDLIETTKAFYSACNEYNFDKINELTYDTISIIDGTFRADYDKKAYKIIFQWDSTFNPQYNIEYIEQSNADIFVKLSTSSKRFEFLGNNPLVTTHKISFQDNKIRTIELTEYVETDFKIWVEKRDTVVNWIRVNHPELDGFIFDMTKQGAENYRTAINLFNN